MTTQAESEAKLRVPLSRERVLRAAVGVADENGIESLTMRRLAEVLGAEAMSLYHHVANKEDLLDGIVDMIGREINDVVGRIDLPTQGAAWKPAMRKRILSAREVFLRHPWAPVLFQTRTNTPAAVVQYIEAFLGILRDGGISYTLAHKALHALGSRALGFSQELFNPAASRPAGGAGVGVGDAAANADLAAMAAQFPHITAMMMDAIHNDPDSRLGWCDDQAEFEFGLDLVLDGLDRMRETT